MYWTHDAGCFFAGLFLANAVPHFVQGVCGNPFPTPFAKPPGRGLSSPMVNVLWGLVNLAVGYLLARASGLNLGMLGDAVACFAGITAISLPISRHFARKHSS